MLFILFQVKCKHIIYVEFELENTWLHKDVSTSNHNTYLSYACNALGWYTVEYPRSHLHFLCIYIHTVFKLIVCICKIHVHVTYGLFHVIVIIIYSLVWIQPGMRWIIVVGVLFITPPYQSCWYGTYMVQIWEWYGTTYD